jgi:transcription-repair coupling factor (superfamily II helicase)
VETEDQLAAISAIKTDMISNKCMDRLVCGEVGYGKTEVAMRAAFKAVADGEKQVAVLVPTTVLAMQHYENFIERMSNFPINIGVLSRFRSQKQIRETLEGIANGSIDIAIGTHRIISEDVKFKDLGLVIIDEEQRFGVKAKEHLKKIKAGVDCLTLSATPIPRTLYLSLIGPPSDHNNHCRIWRTII